jgi:tetratricopeptide (TPR) repeat protein
MTGALVGTVMALYGAWETPNKLGNIHQAQARYAEAEADYRSALVVIEAFHRRDAAFAAVANNLGALLQRRGRFDEADRFYRNAIDAWTAALPASQRDLARAYSNAGSLAMNRGRNDEALARLNSARGIQVRLKDSSLAHTLVTMANAEHARGDIPRAETLLAEARRAHKEFGGAPEVETSIITTQCGLLAALGRLPEALDACHQARNRLQAEFGDSHPRTALIDMRLGQIHLAGGDPQDAADRFRQAASTYARSPGEQSLAYARALLGLASTRRAEKQYSSALTMIRQADSIFASFSEEGLPDRLTALQLEGDLHRLLGNPVDAQLNCRRALELAEKIGGPDSLLVSDALNTLGVALFQSPGEAQNSAGLFERSIAIRLQRLGPAHPALAEPLGNLAYVFLAQGRPDDAAPLFERSLALRQQATGVYHPSQLPALQGYVASLDMLHRKDEARWARTLLRRVASEAQATDPSAHILTFDEWKRQAR